MLSREKGLNRELMTRTVINLPDDRDLRKCYIELEWNTEEDVLYSDENNDKLSILTKI